LSAETSLFAIVLAGVAMLAAGLIHLVVAAFRVRPAWGVAVLLFPPLGLVFALKHRRVSAPPLITIALGLAIASTPYLYSRSVPIDLGPRESKVGDELHITLTGWDRHDYSVLRARPQTVVLQMANPDVTDETLDFLKGMTQLRELDLSGSQIDDDGLRRLASLTALRSLRLMDTKITDKGFQDWLAPRESLRQLDLRGTQVSRETGRAWRAARPGRRLLQ
jgi:hypothetical protein